VWKIRLRSGETPEESRETSAGDRSRSGQGDGQADRRRQGHDIINAGRYMFGRRPKLPQSRAGCRGSQNEGQERGHSATRLPARSDVATSRRRWRVHQSGVERAKRTCGHRGSRLHYRMQLRAGRAKGGLRHRGRNIAERKDNSSRHITPWTVAPSSPTQNTTPSRCSRPPGLAATCHIGNRVMKPILML
jgi:hypothetical protein